MTLTEILQSTTPNPETGCLEWNGLRNPAGYGRVRVSDSPRRWGLAHRRVAELVSERPLARHAVVRHTCDNPCCVNPAHLLVGTHADNTRDMVSKGRHVCGERSPQAKLTAAQVLEIRALRGVRTLEEIARMFGTTPGNISHIHRRIRWAHI
jgi:hypothetical protein